jgi:hypothetical protein
MLNNTIFDDYIPNTAVDRNTAVTTSASLNSTLGQYDQINLQVIADNAAAAANLTVIIQHSADGRNWIERVPLTFGVPGSTTLSDAGTNPMLGYVRIAFFLSVATTVHVKVFAAMRDGR